VIENIQVQYQQFVSAKDRETSLVAAVAGAQIVVNSYRRQFIAGRKSWLEVLNAVREQNDYQVQLSQTRADMLGAFHRLQVDFGIMPWQQFGQNRQPVSLFKPTDTVKAWINKQDKKRASQNLGYKPEVSGLDEEYIEIRLPAEMEDSLNRGARIMLNEDYSITPIVDSNNGG